MWTWMQKENKEAQKTWGLSIRNLIRFLSVPLLLGEFGNSSYMVQKQRFEAILLQIYANGLQKQDKLFDLLSGKL